MTARAGGSASLMPKFRALWPRIRVRKLLSVGPLQIWLVRGKIIRDQVFIDFTEGGNSEAYAWMPDDLIILDTDVSSDEIKFVQLHEMRELNEMTAGGLGYEKAHQQANAVEIVARRDPKKFAKLWEREVKTYTDHLAKTKGRDDRVGKSA